MTNTARALWRFFSSFGIPAFIEYDVPDAIDLPYITYQAVDPGWRNNATLYARVWYRSTSYAEIAAKVDEIAREVGEATSIRTDNGCVILSKGTPWAQEMPMEGDDTLKVIYLLFDIQAITD